MKKRIITILLTLCMICGIYTVSVNAASTEYVKVKKTTYQKYKKAYKQNKTYKKKIKTLKQQLEDKNSLNQWTWSSIYSLGLSYKEKTWTLTKSEIPEKFIINGVTYKVVVNE